MNDLYNGDPYGVLRHSAEGTKWKTHKYIRIDNGRYIYKTDSSSSKSTTKSSASSKSNSSAKAATNKSASSSSSKTTATTAARLNRLNRANSIAKASSAAKSSSSTSSKANKGLLTTANNTIISAIQGTKQDVANTTSNLFNTASSAVKDSTDDHETNSTREERDATREYVSEVNAKSMSLILTKTEEYNKEYGGNTIPSRSLEGMEALYLLNQYSYNESNSEGTGQSDLSMKGGCDDAYERSSQIDRIVSATPVSSTHYTKKEAGRAAYTEYTFMNSDGTTFTVEVTDKTKAAYRATMVASNLGDDAIRTRTLSEYNNEEIAALAVFDIYGMTR